MNIFNPNSFPIHYGWIIIFTGTLSHMACLGFGRFAFGMILPSMASSLNLTYSQMGLIGTGNFFGYLLSVLLSGPWIVRFGSRRLITLGLLLVGISMIMVSQGRSFMQVLVLYALTGFGSGVANISTMGLVSSWFTSKKRGMAAGFIVTGSGFAIIFTGKFIPFINALIGQEGWRIGWLLLGSLVTMVAFLSFLLMRNRPEDIGIKPLGADITQHFAHSPGTDTLHPRTVIYRKGILYHLGAIYFFFGLTYVIYITFIVTSLVRERGFHETIAGDFWMWVGFLSLFSGPLFGSLSDKLGRKAGLIIVFILQMVSYLLVASKLPGIFLYLSIILFGICAWSIPSIMVAAVGDYIVPLRVAEAFGFITFFFGLGQITGPSVAGCLAEASGGFSTSFYMSGAFAGIAILLTATLRKPGA